MRLYLFQLVSRRIIDPHLLERGVKFSKIHAKLEKRPIILYHLCIRKTLDLWYREYGSVKPLCNNANNAACRNTAARFLASMLTTISVRNNCREIKQVNVQELASYGQPYDLSSFDYIVSKTARKTNDDLKQWLLTICDILLAVRNDVARYSY